MDKIKTSSQPAITRQSLWFYLSGFLMGAADVVPGVSGGTMAFILGIYESLLDAINTVGTAVFKLLRLQIREAMALIPWGFLIPLLLGIATAIFTIAHGLDWLLEHHAVFVWAFFFGLVLGSVFTIRKRVQPWRMVHFGIAAVFTIGAYWLVGLVPVETPNVAWFFFVSGALAICAMILPGISGAFILVLLGKYAAVLQAVVTLDFVTLSFVVLGAVFGLLTIARILRWLFHTHRSYTIVGLVGLMLGSLRKIWPWKEVQEIQNGIQGTEPFLKEINILPVAFSQEIILVLLLATAGFIVVMVLEALASRRPSPKQVRSQA